MEACTKTCMFPCIFFIQRSHVIVNATQASYCLNKYLLSNPLEIQDSELRQFVNDVQSVGRLVDHWVPEETAGGRSAT